MDWLKRLPVIGPLATRMMMTRAWRSYERLDEVRWSRLAAAMTFISFIAIFPLLTFAAAVVAGTMGESRQGELENRIKDQIPGIADQLDLQALFDNAGTVGVVAAALLLVTGIGWVGSMRECLRVVWELPDKSENPVLRKVKDAGVLAGLGAAGLASVAASTLASTAVGWAARGLGVNEHGWGGLVLQAIGFLAAVLADFLLLLYVLTLLPGVHPDRRSLIVASLIGAIGFELLKLLIGGYIKGVAGKSMYGAFGVPIALLLWINFTAKLLLFCAAWTATKREDRGEGRNENENEHGNEPGNGNEHGNGNETDGKGEAEGAGTAGEVMAAPKKPVFEKPTSERPTAETPASTASTASTAGATSTASTAGATSAASATDGVDGVDGTGGAEETDAASPSRPAEASPASRPAEASPASRPGDAGPASPGPPRTAAVSSGATRANGSSHVPDGPRETHRPRWPRRQDRTR
ncbi:hypothetical protein GBW32_22950 [Streptomyces tsukubensis]|nr:hypothetical protein GBW32_22950 [Streptomyces tsukubensis]